MMSIALVVGLVAREAAYRFSSPIRYGLNQRNAFYWGDRIVHPAADARPGAVAWAELWRSFVATYQANEANPAPDINTLDYVPLRLLMAGVWVNYLNIAHGPVSAWRPEFARSFAAFSMAMELAGAAAMFMLVARWLKHAQTPIAFGLDRWRTAAGAAIVLWLDPASIVDSHVWPHGQTWIVVFYLASMLAMLEGRAFLAGAIFSVGVMFKGQMLLVAPLLIVWPMFDRRWRAAMLAGAGMICGAGAIVLPWLIRGNFAWMRAGFGAAGVYSDVLRKGTALNLPALLEKACNATLHQHLIDARIAGVHVTLELRTALFVAYAMVLTCVAWGIARQARRRDRRLLVSIAAPWALMFFVLGQMDERYLVWSACFTAGAIAVGRMQLAVHAIFSVAGAATMLEFLLIEAPATANSPAARILVALNPIVWLLIAGAVAVLFATSLRSPKRAATSNTSAPAAAAEPLVAAGV